MTRLQPEPKKMIRACYDWVLSWSEKPDAMAFLFIMAVIESIFFPVPPDVLLIAIVIAKRESWFKAAFLCLCGSVIGGIIGYGVGYGMFETIGRPIVEFYNAEATMKTIKIWCNEWGFLGVLAAALTPIPYKVVTITAGLVQFNLIQFIVASFIGRSTRFFMVSFLINKLGPPVKDFIDRYFDILSILFFILLLGGFFLLKYLK
ncbi:YqaA family protein [Candidatus Riflebacteria bacterium]